MFVQYARRRVVKFRPEGLRLGKRRDNGNNGNSGSKKFYNNNNRRN